MMHVELNDIMELEAINDVEKIKFWCEIHVQGFHEACRDSKVEVEERMQIITVLVKLKKYNLFFIDMIMAVLSECGKEELSLLTHVLVETHPKAGRKYLNNTGVGFTII